MKCPEINPVEETVDAEEISEDFEGSLVME
jgi:hypothetical protein